jgi:hypothetical protein
MAIIRDMDIHMVKITMVNILTAGMDIRIKNMDITILKVKAKVEVKVKKSSTSVSA